MSLTLQRTWTAVELLAVSYPSSGVGLGLHGPIGLPFAFGIREFGFFACFEDDTWAFPFQLQNPFEVALGEPEKILR